MNRKIVLLTMGTMLCSASAAMADPIGDPFRACGKIAEDKARLACFDEALQSLDQRQAVVQQTQKEQAEAEYGLKKFETRKQAETEKPEVRELGPAGVEELRSRIAEVFVQNVNGRHIVVLENGQMWRQTSVSSFRGTLRAGMEVTISEGAIGGYRMKFEGKSGFLGVTRVK